MDLSIIFVNWNTKDITCDCLRSVYDQTKSISFEVLLVDNASSDDSVAKIRHDFPQVDVIESHQNLGFARGNNLALKKAKGRYIVLLNTDTLIQDGALQKMVTYLDQHPQTGAATPMLIGRDGQVQYAAAKDPTLWRYAHEYLLHRYPCFYDDAAYQQTMSVEIVVGACMFVRREVVQQVGPLPEEYFMYVEDVEWSQRIRQAGWAIDYVADAKVTHFGGESSKLNQAKMNQALLDSRIQHMQRHHGVIQALALRGVIAGYKLRHAIGDWRRSHG